jgi:acetyltransferase EpsM
MKSNINKIPPKVILWGSTGAAKEAKPVIEYYEAKVVAVFDDTKNLKSPFPDVPIYCGYDKFLAWLEGKDRENIGFCLAIGNPHGRVRLNLHDRLIKEGLTPITFAHPSAVVAEDAIIGLGTQILAGAIIDSGNVVIGKQCIINLNSVVSHDSVLEDGVEIGPSATVCGNVYIESNAWVGAGATVLPNIKIGHDAKVGIGSVVMKDVPKNKTVFGIPAKVLPFVE